MSFHERLKKARISADLTQKELAIKINKSERTIQHYELGTRIPKNIETVEQLATILNVEVNDLLDQRNLLLIDAQTKGGSKSVREVDKLVSEVSGLFAGGDLDDGEKDNIMAAISRAYWDAKTDNKKYVPKKYKKL